MKLGLVLYLTISTGVPEQVLPVVPPLPSGLPQAQARPDGTFLPSPLDRAVMERLLYLDRYPELCQSALGRQDDLWRQDEDRKVQAARAGKMPDWLVVALGLLGMAGAGYVGYRVGVVVGGASK